MTSPESPTDPASRAGIVDPERTGIAIATRLSSQDATALAESFRLLGDPTRVRILYALLAAEELCVGDLAHAVAAPETSVSHALRLLRTAGVVTSRRSGRQIYYVLADHHVCDLLEISRSHHQEDRQ